MSAPHTVVFLGTSAFAVPCLRALAGDSRFTVQLVITQPDRAAGRKQAMTPPAVKTAALELGLPVLQPEKVNAEAARLKAEMSPDFLIVVSYGQILSDDVLGIPIIAPVNVHASLLPELRGASPIQHAILEGLAETGVTVQRMVRELDAGPILTQQSLKIDARETYATLHEKLAAAGADLLASTLSLALTEREQEHDKATFCRKLTKADGAASSTTMTAETIDRMVRALTPWPGVTLGDIKLLETSLTPSPDAMAIACSDGTTLYALTLQPAGGKPMSGRSYANGRTASAKPPL